MDFPRKTFPYQYCHHTKQREIFGDYGCHGNIDIRENNEIISQKKIGGFIRDAEIFKSRRPTLPLHTNTDFHGNYNRVMTKIRKQQNCARMLKAAVTSIKFKKTLTDEDKKLLKNIWNDLTLDNQDKAGDLHIPGFLQNLIKQYQGCKDLTDFKKNNSLYAGGCISCVSSSQKDGRIFSATGPNFDAIKTTAISLDSDLVLSPGTSVITDINCAASELCSQNLRETDYVAVRGGNLCKILACNDTDDPEGLTLTCVDTISMSEEEHATSVCLSPYIPGECLVTSDSGNVVLWTAGVGKTEVLSEKAHRFDVSDSWRQGWFGGHPRELVMADLTAVEVHDMRNHCDRGLELFALSSKFLHPIERVRIGKQHPVSPFCHVVATDFSLFLMDQRFPLHPILQWQHMLRNPPQFLSVLKEDMKGHSLILIASQSPPDVCCYLFNNTSENIIQAFDSPWCLSRIDDFTKYLCKGENALIANDWFDGVSLTGIAALPHDKGFTGIQMDSCGEIFYQSFEWTDRPGDKTFTFGPGACDLKVDKITENIGEKWTDNLKQQLCSNSDINVQHVITGNQTIVDQSKQTLHKFKDLVLKKKPHPLCSLCSSYRTDQDTINHLQVDQKCPACLQILDTGHCIATNESNCVIKNYGSIHGDWKRLQEPNQMPMDDPLSQILHRLWQEDEPDLSDLLLLRDKEILERQKEVKEKKVQSKPSKPSYDDDVDLFEFFTKSNSIDQADQDFEEPEPDANKSSFFGNVITRGLFTEQDYNRFQNDEMSSSIANEAFTKICSSTLQSTSATNTSIPSVSNQLLDTTIETFKSKFLFASPTMASHSKSSGVVNSPSKKPRLNSAVDQCDGLMPANLSQTFDVLASEYSQALGMTRFAHNNGQSVCDSDRNSEIFDLDLPTSSSAFEHNITQSFLDVGDEEFLSQELDNTMSVFSSQNSSLFSPKAQIKSTERPSNKKKLLTPAESAKKKPRPSVSGF